MSSKIIWQKFVNVIFGLNFDQGRFGFLFQRIVDPIAAIVVVTIIAVNAVGSFRENMSYLLGRAPSKDVMTQMENLASSVPGVLAVHDLRAAYIGPNAVHTDIRIVVAPDLAVVEAHDIAKAVEDLLKPLFGNGTCTIHVDANPAESPE